MANAQESMRPRIVQAIWQFICNILQFNPILLPNLIMSSGIIQNGESDSITNSYLESKALVLMGFFTDIQLIWLEGQHSRA